MYQMTSRTREPSFLAPTTHHHRSHCFLYGNIASARKQFHCRDIFDFFASHNSRRNPNHPAHHTVPHYPSIYYEYNLQRNSATIMYYLASISCLPLPATNHHPNRPPSPTTGFYILFSTVHTRNLGQRNISANNPFRRSPAPSPETPCSPTSTFKTAWIHDASEER
jgi:hypothetical protein